jgi:ABC-type glycerol-3-phosphate transport system substrate-binding protein
MKNKLSPFQIALYGFLIVAIVAGVIVFSLQRTSESENAFPVTAWGTLSRDVVDTLIEEANKRQKNSLDITYTEYSESEFESVFIEGLASGIGPDIVFMDESLLLKHENKLYEVGYDLYSQREYRSTFIEAGDILLKQNGIVGFPFQVDPLVMYWNRTTLNAAGISTTPEYWDQILQLVPQLVRTDSDLRIEKAAVAMGEFRNINHAKEILITLIQQAGNPVVARGSRNEEEFFAATLNDSFDYSIKPAQAALDYFVQFSNPSLNSYSWNRSLPTSKEMFLSGDLAFYIGYASEFPDLRRKNPNLNFDVSILPQSRSSDDNVSTTGSMVFVGMPKNSPNLSAAFNAIVKLVSKENIDELVTLNNLPPVRRDSLVEQNDNAIMQTFFDAALIVRPFIEPNVESSNKIFSDMVESYISGRSNAAQVLLRAQNQLSDLIK